MKAFFPDTTWSIFIDGDNHYGYYIDKSGVALPREGKADIVDNMIKTYDNMKPDFIINTGDLCSHGYDKKCIFPFCWKINGDSDEFGAFLSDYYEPLLDHGIKLYLTPGNHDTYVEYPYFKKPVFKFIKNTYDATYSIFNWKKSGCYKFTHKFITFINMGVYPNNISWLKCALEDINYESPIVFIFHYTISDDAPYNDWWEDSEKDNFYETIKNHNVILICNGHDHETRIDNWRDIPCVIGSGDNSFGIVQFRNNKFVKFVSNMD
jgi:3',5'-cyclic AMP phosphodiesterase CpdA